MGSGIPRQDKPRDRNQQNFKLFYFFSFLFFFLYIESISSVGIEAAVNFFERFVGGHPPKGGEKSAIRSSVVKSISKFY